MSDSLSRELSANNMFTQDIANKIVKEVNCKCLIDEPLSTHTSLRVGGPARLYVYPKTIDDLSSLVKFCKSIHLNSFVIGYGTNLLVSDDGYAGCIIDLSDACRDVNIDDTHLECGASVWGTDMVRQAAEVGLGGLDKLAGIPGGIGGWVWMNGGAFGSAISDHIVSLKVMDYEGNVSTMNKKDVGFIYRASPGLEGKIILTSEFSLPKEESQEVKNKIEATIAERFRRNVMTLPSAGSVFKNPPGNFAAKLIESIGGKGMQMGGVEVSPLHANFIVNSRGGKAQDVVDMINKIRRLVFERYDIALELEVRRLGFNEEILEF